MTGDACFRAVILDMDGVLTRTADVHQQAWAEVFDDLLERRGEERDERFRPFSHEDYRRFVDGKPRHDGVRDFLASRNIELPPNADASEPDADTVTGLARRKNARFLALLDEVGVRPYRDAAIALRRWRRGNLHIAVVSASRNCRRVLRAAGLLELPDVIVDGVQAAELALDGKRGIIREAVRRVAVPRDRCVLVEDAAAGAFAARALGIGLVVGIDRHGHGDELQEAGAHRVVTDLGRLRFRRRLPAAFERWADIVREGAGRRLALFLDFDGTLAPIVADPDDANLAEGTRRILAELSGVARVAIISGRDRDDVQRRVGHGGLIYAGSHGLDIAGPGLSHVAEVASAAGPQIERVARELDRRLAGAPGVYVEHKRFSVAVHVRRVTDPDVAAHALRIADQVARDSPALRKQRGRKVVELMPAGDWDKGRALSWIMQACGIDPTRELVIYVGDDETDEDAFVALGGRGLSIHVGDRVTSSLADYGVDSPVGVTRLLRWMGEMSGRQMPRADLPAP